MHSAVWKFESDLVNRLLLWSAFSLLSGLYIWFATNEFGRGFGIQAVFWGAVDGLIAIVGGVTAARRKSTADPTREASAIRKILWVNVGLDVFYILGGVWVLFSWQGDFWKGTGWGIILQGAFLFLFDLFHAMSVPKEVK